MGLSIPTPVWGAIVARALLGSTFCNGGPLLPEDELEFRLEPGDSGADATELSTLLLDVRRANAIVVSLSLGPFACKPVPSERLSIGRPWYPTDAKAEGGIRRVRLHRDDTPTAEHEVLSPCLLMPIGDSAIRAAKTIAPCVAGIVEIDDRPVIGGGLPDFWQSNLGRVVRACLRNPNIRRIVATGVENGAAQTIHRLKLSQSDWTSRLDDLQRRLSIGVAHLSEFRARDIGLEIVPGNVSQMLKVVAGYTASTDLRGPDKTQPINLDLERLARRLAIPAATVSNQLSIADGFRCKSLADAYPQAVQLLRSSDEPAQTEPTRRTFREFPCFKLVLSDPFQDEVPDYWASEEESLNDYVERNFNSPQGLFGQRLVSSSHKREPVRNYGVNAVMNALKERRPTRRIMLPVATGDEQTDQPLGLIMIQILPRQRGGRWHLDFQWIWRTVEALVGFPFSAIGSIRWSRAFFESVKERIDADAELERLELGQLTYLALSFHMFLDAGDLEIARAIVQDATR